MTALQEFIAAHGLHGQTPIRSTRTAGRKALCGLFRALGFTRGAEIGVWQGKFSEELCQTNPGLRLMCVDPWKSYDDYGDPKNVQGRLDLAYRQTMKRLAPYGCEIRRMSSSEAADHVPDGSLDFAYIDGNHAKAYVLADLHAWAPKVRSGGIISGHDFELVKRHGHVHVREAVDDYARINNVDPIYVLSADKSPSFFWVAP